MTGWATALAAALAAVAVLRSVAVPASPAPHRLTPAERYEVGRAAAAEEPKWRLDSIHHFPGDCWSQDDDYHAAEMGWVRDEAARRRAPIADVFWSIDEDLKRFPVEPPRKAGACPCKPRPFYD